MGKAVKKVTSNPLRSLAAVGTLGGSELAIAGAKKLGIGLEDEEGNYISPEQVQQGKYREFANNYDREMGLADAGVQGGALTKDVFGSGGLQSRLAEEGRQLADSGFQLQKGDREAYGQASGDISRLFGQQEQAASQSLARRGLASGSSGAAGATFSGLAGNKNEMLASAQMDIAQKRIQDTRARALDNAKLQADISSVGANLSRSRFSDKESGLRNAVSVEGVGNEQKRIALADQEASRRPGLFSTVGQGLQAGIASLATQAPGLIAGGMVGGAAGSGVSRLPNSSNSGFSSSSYGSSGFSGRKGPSLFG